MTNQMWNTNVSINDPSQFYTIERVPSPHTLNTSQYNTNPQQHEFIVNRQILTPIKQYHSPPSTITIRNHNLNSCSSQDDIDYQNSDHLIEQREKNMRKQCYLASSGPNQWQPIVNDPYLATTNTTYHFSNYNPNDTNSNNNLSYYDQIYQLNQLRTQYTTSPTNISEYKNVNINFYPPTYHKSSTSTTHSTFNKQYPHSRSPSPIRKTPTRSYTPSDTMLMPSETPISSQGDNLSPVSFTSPIPSPTVFTTTFPGDSIRSTDETKTENIFNDNLHYTMNDLIQKLIPTDNYIPETSFIYSMFMCSRIHIRPSVLLNHLAVATIDSITNVTHDQRVRILRNFLFILSQWTRTFPYDYRSTEMKTQLEDLLRKINDYENSLQSDTNYIYKKLCSKLEALAQYKNYIRQLDHKAANNLNENALLTDIMNECQTPLLFAQQLTHIELDRLKPIGAEELLLYFIMKMANEEAKVHPKKHLSSMNNTNINMLVHDKKHTFCLEAYIQWFNRLTFFVTTEVVKHLRKRSRIRVINYFIDAAYECFRLHNFNSMIGILGGLNMQPVRRLKRTWEKVQQEKFKQLEHYTDVSKNFSSYRLILKTAVKEADKSNWSVDKIVIPFTSILLQDVYFIKTHSKDYTSAGGINLKKYYMMAKFISEEFVHCKTSRCSFKRNEVIINYIITSPIFNEDSLMLASFECEQAETPNDRDKLRTLKTSVNMQ
ncbi:unnamed protein product [Didymodactylos carnosus]|uniref:Ras guanine nucleotide exchange factor n=1 Tax=Didymodactylos carnosus TaxID=1234261 RepID=A0A813N8S5_9BILA|nr:unnamed protein product [Didymodactylos carnosus]CAF0877780.1 unnamed protein product [Didymodactylos carnosus]CAF3514289.1 unnamed protein product [Didymodactylos carnosus]CAF3661949.1 unnamed protein product [Didymodactylos carnosus]